MKTGVFFRLKEQWLILKTKDYTCEQFIFEMLFTKDLIKHSSSPIRTFKVWAQFGPWSKFVSIPKFRTFTNASRSWDAFNRQQKNWKGLFKCDPVFKNSLECILKGFFYFLKVESFFIVFLMPTNSTKCSHECFFFKISICILKRPLFIVIR